MERKRARKAQNPGSAPETAREVMDIKDLAIYLGMGKSKIYALIRQKKIPASRIGRQYRFSKDVIDQWLKEKLITHSQDAQIPLFSAAAPAPSNEAPS